MRPSIPDAYPNTGANTPTVSTRHAARNSANKRGVNMATLRFISDSAHGWLEVPTVDVAAAGVTPSRYSYIDATTGMTYLEEDCDASAYINTQNNDMLTTDLGDIDYVIAAYDMVYIDGLCWVRDLPPAA